MEELLSRDSRRILTTSGNSDDIRFVTVASVGESGIGIGPFDIPDLPLRGSGGGMNINDDDEGKGDPGGNDSFCFKLGSVELAVVLTGGDACCDEGTDSVA